MIFGTRSIHVALFFLRHSRKWCKWSKLTFASKLRLMATSIHGLTNQLEGRSAVNKLPWSTLSPAPDVFPAQTPQMAQQKDVVNFHAGKGNVILVGLFCVPWYRHQWGKKEFEKVIHTINPSIRRSSISTSLIPVKIWATSKINSINTHYLKLGRYWSSSFPIQKKTHGKTPPFHRFSFNQLVSHLHLLARHRIGIHLRNAIFADVPARKCWDQRLGSMGYFTDPYKWDINWGEKTHWSHHFWS